MSSNKNKSVNLGDDVSVGDNVVIAKSPYDKRVGFTCGSFDLIHPGHIVMLEEAKSTCDFLVVAVQSDPTIDRPGKNKPIQTHEERLIMVSAIKYVDEVVSYDTESDLVQLLKEIRPDVRIIGADHKGKKFTGHELPIEIHYNSRDHEWSTTNLRKLVYKTEKHIMDWTLARR